MKTKTLLIISVIALFSGVSSHAQTALKSYKIGHSFNISIPDYMSRTIGLNESATVQYKNEVKEVYSFVIEDAKEELKLAELNFSSIAEFYDSFIKDFAKDEKERELSKSIISKKGNTNFIEADLSYFDAESQIRIYYLVGVVETPNSYYKVISWTLAESKDKFKEDFRKILYSLSE